MASGAAGETPSRPFAFCRRTAPVAVDTCKVKVLGLERGQRCGHHHARLRLVLRSSFAATPRGRCWPKRGCNAALTGQCQLRGIRPGATANQPHREVAAEVHAAPDGAHGTTAAALAATIWCAGAICVTAGNKGWLIVRFRARTAADRMSVVGRAEHVDLLRASGHSGSLLTAALVAQQVQNSAAHCTSAVLPAISW